MPEKKNDQMLRLIGEIDNLQSFSMNYAEIAEKLGDLTRRNIFVMSAMRFAEAAKHAEIGARMLSKLFTEMSKSEYDEYLKELNDPSIESNRRMGAGGQA